MRSASELKVNLTLCTQPISSMFWSWDKQLNAMTIVSNFLKPNPGSLLVEFQMGSPGPAQELNTAYGNEGRLAEFTQYQHDEDSLQIMWDEIEKSTGVRWKVSPERSRARFLEGHR